MSRNARKRLSTPTAPEQPRDIKTTSNYVGPPCQKTTRVPLSGSAGSIGCPLPGSITLLLVFVELKEHLIPMGFVRKCEIYVLVVLRQVGFVLIARQVRREVDAEPV